MAPGISGALPVEPIPRQAPEAELMLDLHRFLGGMS
jgi:hypothetical protein